MCMLVLYSRNSLSEGASHAGSKEDGRTQAGAGRALQASSVWELGQAEQEGAGWGGRPARLRGMHNLRQDLPFIQKMTIHVRTHTGDRPFVCITCGQVFSQSSSLTTNGRAHTSTRPYACTTCVKTFSTSSGLVRHCSKVHAFDQE